MAVTDGIVDMRLRPCWLHPFFGSTPGTPDYEVVRWLNRRVGSRDIDHFAASVDLPSLLAEMDQAPQKGAGRDDHRTGDKLPAIDQANPGHPAVADD